MNFWCRIHIYCNEVILGHFCFGCCRLCWFGYLSLFLLWRHVIQYLCAARAGQRVMAGIWHWHSCINQGAAARGNPLSITGEKNPISLWAVSYAGQSTMPFGSNLMRNPQSVIPSSNLLALRSQIDLNMGQGKWRGRHKTVWQICWKLGKLLAYGGLRVWAVPR